MELAMKSMDSDWNSPDCLHSPCSNTDCVWKEIRKNPSMFIVCFFPWLTMRFNEPIPIYANKVKEKFDIRFINPTGDIID